MADFQEGDYVPGKGILMPDGTYRATKPGDVGDTTGDSTLAQENKSGAAPVGIPYDPAWASKGLTLDIWKKMNSVQQAQSSIVLGMALSNYAQNTSSLSIPQALQQALNDPSIISKYSDALNIDKNQLQNSLVDAQTALSTTAEQQRIDFEKDRKALAESHAATGTAYSGFRQQAEKNLATTESGIVTSTRSQQAQSLRQAQQAFEAKYGTRATQSLSFNYKNPLNGTTNISGQYNSQSNPSESIFGANTGGIIGSQEVAKSADITKMALDNIQSREPVPVTPIPK